ncbi:MAG: hypothetical protein ACLPWD_03405 [Methanobacterium sp.]
MGSVQIFIGCIDEEIRNTSIIRNGKTCAMTGFNWLDWKYGWEVWANYQCSFASVMGFQAMIDKIRTEDLSNRKIILSVTEFGQILDSVGSKMNQVLFCDYFFRQIGKIGGTTGEILFRGDLQRFASLHKRIRIHVTDILVPVKFHKDDDTQCNGTKCLRPHKIKVYYYNPNPEFDKPLKIFDAEKIGKMYDSYEICKDFLNLPNEKELKKMGILNPYAGGN